MSCNCFEDLKKRIEGKIKESLSEHTEFKGSWKNTVYFFGKNPPTIPVVIPYEYSYRSIKTSGEPYKNKTTTTMSVTMTYCPFCGESTEKEKTNENS